MSSSRGLLRLLLVIVTICIGLSQGYAQSQTAVQPSHNSKAITEKRMHRVTIAQRKAAAIRAAAKAKTAKSGKTGFAAVASTPVPGGTPNYFGPEPNWAYSPMPTVDPTTGTISGGIRKFVDKLPGMGAANANNLGQYLPVAIPDTTTYPGSDYYEIELVQYTEKMHSDLPPTTLRGYRQVNTTDPTVSVPHYLGPIIIAQRDRPIRVKFTNKLPTGAGGDLFLPVDTTVMGAGMGPEGMNPRVGGMNYTQNRATLHLHGGHTPWISDGTPHQWITPAGEVTSYPKGVSVQNVPDMPDPGDGSMTFFYTNQQSARLMFYHDHAYGITRLNVYAGEAAGYIIQDQVEQDLVSKGIIPSEQIPLIIQDKTFVDSNTVLKTDPTWNWGSTPGVPNTGDLWYPHVYMPNQNPNDLAGINPMGRWDYGPWFWPPWPVSQQPVALPDGSEAPGIPDTSMVMEAFMDTPVVNGTAYPYLEVQPKAYRLRILNAADDRYWNLQIHQADPAITSGAGVGTEVKMVNADNSTAWPVGWPTPDLRDGGLPDPNLRGPDMIQIGNESGFLAAPVVFNNKPIGFDRDPRSITVGNVKEHNLFLGPAERADVIVDFSAYAGKTLILYNDAPAPVPASDSRNDYYTGDPDQTDIGGATTTLPGYGPNTRTIMQIRVANAAPAPAFDQTALNSAFASTSTAQGVFAKDQDPIIVPQAGYNSAYNASFPADKRAYVRIQDTSLTFTPMGATAPMTINFNPKAIAEEFEDTYGRMTAFLGVEVPFTNGMNQTTIFYGYLDPATEILNDSMIPMSPVAGDGTQIWKITHNGVDTHAVHFHLFDVQLINRVDWAGVVKPPEPNELGWKDTVRMNPLEDCIVALRPVAPKLPFGIPDSVRPLDPTMPIGSTMGFKNVDPLGNPITVVNEMTNFGWEYVWHCHLLSHEEMDMMRPMVFNVAYQAPQAPVLSAAQSGNNVNLTWTDGTPAIAASTWGNPQNEIGFRVERATGASGAFSTVGTALANATSFVDITAVQGQMYSYRVVAYNKAGDSVSNSVVVGAPPPPPAAPTNLTAVASLLSANPPSVTLAWVDNATNETGFTIQRATNNNFNQGLTAISVGANVTTFTDTTVGLKTKYYYRVIAFNAGGQSAVSNTANATTRGQLPAAPMNLAAAISTTPALAVNLTWSDMSANETGFTIQRAINTAFSQGLATFTAAANATAYSDTTVQPNSTYYYRVQAYNADGNSLWSNNVTAVTPGLPPSAPTNLRATTIGTNYVILGWTDNANNESGFYVEQSGNGGTTWTQVGVTAANTTAFRVNGLSSRTAYTYRVRAFNANGVSGYTNTLNVTTK